MKYYLETIVRMGEYNETAIVIRTGDTYWSDSVPDWFRMHRECVYIKSNSVHDISETDFEPLKAMLRMKEYPMTRAVYEREEHYGGPEEGGWYYHTKKRVDGLNYPIGLDSYGEGYLEEFEIYEDEYDQLNRPYYS